eukprot:9037071-Pyramimonas_sp.AAC.1
MMMMLAKCSSSPNELRRGAHPPRSRASSGLAFAWPSWPPPRRLCTGGRALADPRAPSRRLGAGALVELGDLDLIASRLRLSSVS